MPQNMFMLLTAVRDVSTHALGRTRCRSQFHTLSTKPAVTVQYDEDDPSSPRCKKHRCYYGHVHEECALQEQHESPLSTIVLVPSDSPGQHVGMHQLLYCSDQGRFSVVPALPYPGSINMSAHVVQSDLGKEPAECGGDDGGQHQPP